MGGWNEKKGTVDTPRSPVGAPGSRQRVSHGLVLHQGVHDQADHMADIVEAYLGTYEQTDIEAKTELGALDASLHDYREAVTTWRRG